MRRTGERRIFMDIQSYTSTIPTIDSDNIWAQHLLQMGEWGVLRKLFCPTWRDVHNVLNPDCILKHIRWKTNLTSSVFVWFLCKDKTYQCSSYLHTFLYASFYNSWRHLVYMISYTSHGFHGKYNKFSLVDCHPLEATVLEAYRGEDPLTPSQGTWVSG